MQEHFQIEMKKSRGNLHVALHGNLEKESALELVHALSKNYEGRGRVFIDTERLGEVSPAGCRAFQCGLNSDLLPAELLFFKGEKGFQMAPRGSKILILGPRPRRCHCSGRCAVCKCTEKAKLAS